MNETIAHFCSRLEILDRLTEATRPLNTIADSRKFTPDDWAVLEDSLIRLYALRNSITANVGRSQDAAQIG